MGTKKAQIHIEHYSLLCEIEYNHVFSCCKYEDNI